MRTKRRKEQYCDVNIEFAHVEFGENDMFDKTAVRQSSNIAREIHAKLTREGLTCVTSILVDDKQLPPKTRLSPSSVAPLLRLAQKDLRVDYISFESRVALIWRRLLRMVPPTAAERIKRRILSYISKHGKTACSHDIAIWHLLRLGLLNRIGPDLVIPYYVIESELPPFKARIALSVLSSSMEESEAIAQKEILKYCSIPSTRSRIVRIYFDKLGKTSPSVDKLVREIIRWRKQS